jgi:hypothetical protein
LHAEKFEGGEKTDNEDKKKKKTGDKLTFYAFHGSFNQKKPEEKHYEDKSSANLVPELLLAKEIPD